MKHRACDAHPGNNGPAEWSEADDAVIADIVATALNCQQRRDYRPQTRFGRTLAFWAPKRFVSSTGIDVVSFVAELDRTIRARGMILYDRQIVSTSLAVIEWIESIFEPESPEGSFEVPPRVEWGEAQQRYFGLDDPYQMTDDPGDFTWSHIVIGLPEPYLRPEELIAGVIDGVEDSRYLECTCHSASVVYTTRHRLVCMSCGMTHLVLSEPLYIVPTRLLTADEWVAFFDPDGTRHEEEIDLVTIDFREVEGASFIWSTAQWESAAHELVFFARSSPEEIAEAVRGTEMDPDIQAILVEQGWTPVDTPPPPAFQLLPHSVDVNLLENAAHALRDGVGEFTAAYVKPERLVSAIPDLFRCTELLLKVRLQAGEACALDDRPNNPTVLNRLRNIGVELSTAELTTIIGLRRVRNDLQHGAASFNQRCGLSLCRESLVFIDRFVGDELGMWIGDVVVGNDWRHLLTIAEVAATADTVVGQRLLPYRSSPQADISTCATCGHDSVLRPHRGAGAVCAYCGAVPRDVSSEVSDDRAG